jgi:protein TonB
MRSFMAQAVVVSVLAHGALALAWQARSGEEAATAGASGPLQVSLLAAASPPRPPTESRPQTVSPPDATSASPPEVLPALLDSPSPSPSPSSAAEPRPLPPEPLEAARQAEPAPNAEPEVETAPPVAESTSLPAQPTPTPMNAVQGLDVAAELERQYKTALRAAIAQERRYPRLSRRLGQEGVVAVRFEVLRDGRIEAVGIAEGSGHAPLDAAAVAAVERVGQFEPIPEPIARERWALVVPLDYRL